ncbi:MAG: DUF262 domain-containing protein [Myxococcales bacterium]|nr:DUF262 domain-containing protein [Myxococcales bacterium]
MHRRASTQDVSWFIDLDRNKQLNLSPTYQRRSVWTRKDRRYFLDTIFSGFPCPAIFLHKRLEADGRSIYDVVDGKQRLETILLFAGNKLTLGDMLDEKLSGKKWEQLTPEQRKVLWDYVLPVEQLDFATNEISSVDGAFDRLNRNSKTLQPQELRHARFDGWLIALVESEVATPVWSDLGVVTKARSNRMKDSQFLTELLLVVIERAQSGFSQDHLDEACAMYDDPDDEGVDIDTDGVVAKFELVKNFLVKANDGTQVVREASKHLGAFYSLWALVALHETDLDKPDKFAAKYAAFVQRASTLRDLGYQPPKGQQQAIDGACIEYDRALQGAHTDLNPRKQRLSVLLGALKK